MMAGTLIESDVFVAGAGVGGSACALAACAAGLTVVISEETDWVGGQFTAQATPPDEHGWIEEFGCTARYRDFRDRVRRHYRENYPLTAGAATDPLLNPGDGWVSPLCAEPRVFLAVFESLLFEFEAAGRLRIIRSAVPVSAEKDGDRVVSVGLRTPEGDLGVRARFFVDATELGDLLPLTGTDFVTGSESRADTGEPSAPMRPRPANSQAFSMCFAMSHHEGEDHTIERPASYDFWRAFVPDLEPAWPGPLLSLTGLSPRTMEPVTYNFQPGREENRAFAGLWTYRRILNRGNFEPGAFDSDVTLVNYPQIDFLLGDLVTETDRRTELVAAAREQSLSFLYFLQTEIGWRGLKIRPDVIGTEDGIAKSPYVRESRRILARRTIAERDVAARFRPGERLAEAYPDSVGIGYYRIDLHPTAGGDNYVDVESLPFRIPLGALVPRRTRNLLPACKNIGTTHITNGCYRLHPVEWNIGEAVGELIAFCLRDGVDPADVCDDERRLAGFQDELRSKGFELEWPADIDLADGDPHRHAMR